MWNNTGNDGLEHEMLNSDKIKVLVFSNSFNI